MKLKNMKEFSDSYSPMLKEKPADPSTVMTYEGTYHKILLSFGVLLLAGVLGWFVPALMLPGLIGGIVLVIVISVKQSKSPGLILAYTALQGLVLGGLSSLLEMRYAGITPQIIIATLTVTAVIFIGQRKGVLKTTPRLTKIFLYSLVGLIGFGIINLILSFSGVFESPFGFYGDSGWIGIGLSVFSIVVASYSFVMDFEYIEKGVNNQLEKNWEWYATFSFMVTFVWMYTEMARLFGIARS